MAVIDYKNIQIVNPEPTGAAGLRLQDNFIALNDLISHNGTTAETTIFGSTVVVGSILKAPDVQQLQIGDNTQAGVFLQGEIIQFNSTLGGFHFYGSGIFEVYSNGTIELHPTGNIILNGSSGDINILTGPGYDVNVVGSDVNWPLLKFDNQISTIFRSKVEIHYKGTVTGSDPTVSIGSGQITIGTTGFPGAFIANHQGDITNSHYITADGVFMGSGYSAAEFYVGTTGIRTILTPYTLTSGGGGYFHVGTNTLRVGTSMVLQVDTLGPPALGFFQASPVAQQGPIADATNATDVITQLNATLAALRNYGLLAT